MKRVLVIGFGNDILKDDRIGLEVARQVKEALGKVCDVVEEPLPGPSLLDVWEGYNKVILIDGILTGENPPGTLLIYGLDDFKDTPGPSPHYAGLRDVLRLSRALEIPLPEEVLIYAVEVQDPYTVKQDLSPSLSHALPGIVEKVAERVREWVSIG